MTEPVVRLTHGNQALMELREWLQWKRKEQLDTLATEGDLDIIRIRQGRIQMIDVLLTKTDPHAQYAAPSASQQYGSET